MCFYLGLRRIKSLKTNFFLIGKKSPRAQECKAAQVYIYEYCNNAYSPVGPIAVGLCI